MNPALPHLRSAALLLALVPLGRTAQAQEAPAEPTDGFNAHGFSLTAYDGDARDPLTVERPGRFHQGEFFFGGLFEYADAPLVYATEDGEEAVLDDIVALNLNLGVAAADFLRFDTTLPLFLSSGGLDGSNGVDLSDVRIGAMFSPLRPADAEDGGGFGLGLAPWIDLPTGDDSEFIGSAGFSGGVKLAATYELRRLTFTGDLGAEFNPAIELENLSGSDQLVAGLGLGYLFDPMTGITLEGHFAPPFSQAEPGDNDPELVQGTASPAEALLSFRKRTSSGFHFTLGGATAVSQGAGAAQYRVFLGAGYGRIGEPTPKDTDLDGFIDKEDTCPEEPETKNGYLDLDGCPDQLATLKVSVVHEGEQWPNADVTMTGSNRSEERVSTTEPFKLEVFPGSEWLGSARYGSCLRGEAATSVRDGKNSMEIQLEVAEAATVAYRVRDEEGNPVQGVELRYTSEAAECIPRMVLTTDERGQGAHKVGAGKHFLVAKAEGYAIDRRSVAVQPGDQQLIEIELSPTKIKVLDKQIVILEKVYFETAKAVIKPVSFELLDEVATTIVANPQIGKVEVSGHTDDQGSDAYNLGLSDDRAKAVKEYLVARGVPADRLVARGYGETLPIATNRTSEGRAQNRRVEFMILGEHASREAAEAASGGGAQ